MEIIAVLNDEIHINQDLAIECALLHDTIEDTNISYEDIYEQFGKLTAQGVQALTKYKKLDKEVQIQDSLERILNQPVEIQMVKMAARITNLGKPPDFWTKNKIIHYKDESIFLFDKLFNANKNLADRLKLKIDTYRKYIE